MSDSRTVYLPISLVIPVRDESCVLGEMSESLQRMTSMPSEIIFVDAGSLDASRSLISGWAESVRSESLEIRLLQAQGAFPGAARNVGIKHASFNWIAFLDAGITPANDWLEQLWITSSLVQADAIYGFCIFSSDHPLGRIFCALTYGQGNCSPVLPASLFKITTFYRAGFFVGHLRAGEDLIFKKQLFDAGITVARCPNARVLYTHFPVSIGKSIQKVFRYEFSFFRYSSLRPWRLVLLSIIPLIYLALFLNIIIGLSMLSLYIIARGVIDPIRRSGGRCWWKFPWQPAAAIPIVIILDIVRVFGLLAGVTSFFMSKLCNPTQSSR